ncbi:hypothetical protein LFYK43_12840 [Ligilactobacillus salitolerans]|uniref:Uncharacterized protein n=1 Tax=Ligilactobacillus salitolerans TaxID=1808352 RepID=A0A401ITK0_9LACO|nr:hypothetical protein [Ligilactobacillus salitolerans]GBG94825.1 hypothetical protein LFYK43_12840 [Ligilactobacillus salitolerans]
MKQPNEKTAQRLLEETSKNIVDFTESELGLPFAKTVELEEIGYVISSFVNGAYVAEGRMPKRWTREMTRNILAGYFPAYIVMDDVLLGQIVPILVNYFTFLDHEKNQISNSAALIKGAFEANLYLVDSQLNPDAWSDKKIEKMTEGGAAQEFLEGASPEELEDMKQTRAEMHILEQQGELEEEDKHLLFLLDSLFGADDDQPTGKNLHPHMQLHKKTKK